MTTTHKTYGDVLSIVHDAVRDTPTTGDYGDYIESIKAKVREKSAPTDLTGARLLEFQLKHAVEHANSTQSIIRSKVDVGRPNR